MKTGSFGHLLLIFFKVFGNFLFGTPTLKLFPKIYLDISLQITYVCFVLEKIQIVTNCFQPLFNTSNNYPMT
jgi:hypothetical protein